MNKNIIAPTFAGNGVKGYKDDTALFSSFNYPYGLMFDTNTRSLFITDSSNHCIRKVDSKNNVSTVAGVAGTKGYEDGLNSVAKFCYPSGIVIDKEGNLFVCDSNNNCIRKITFDLNKKTIVSTLIKDKVKVKPINKSCGIDKPINGPYGITIKDENMIYTEYYGNCILKITKDRDVSIISGTGKSGNRDDTLSLSTFHHPTGIVIDSKQNIFVCDSMNHRIRKISNDGVVSTLAGSSLGDEDGMFKNAKFNFPVGITIDETSDILYVSDITNNNIKELRLKDQTVKRIAGNDFGFNLRIYDSFNFPVGLTIDKRRGILFVADKCNNRIRKIDNVIIPLFSCHWKQLRLLWISFKKPIKENYLSLLPLDIVKYIQYIVLNN